MFNRVHSGCTDEPICWPSWRQAESCNRNVKLGMESAAEIAARSSEDRKHTGKPGPAQRSKVTNGKELLPGLDMRTAMARRFKDITVAIYSDQGGADHCSESRKHLVRRFAAAAVLAEQMEAKLARGEEIDIQQHALLCSSLVRLAQRIGIGRIARDVTLDALDRYLARPTEGAGA
jgi:hypothetical protein